MSETLLQKLFFDNGKLSPTKIAAVGGLGALAYGAFNPSSGVGKFMGMGSNQRPVGYNEGIPEYGITRTLTPDAFSTTTPTGEPRRPGSGGRRYFTDTTYTPTGKTMSAAINPVNAPVAPVAPPPATTTPPAQTTPTAGLFDALTPQEAMYLLQVLSGGGGLSMDGTTTNVFAQGGAVPGTKGYYLGGSTDGMADQIPATIDKKQPAALSDGEFVIPADVVSHLGNGNSDAGAKVLYSMMDRVRHARTGNKEQGRQIAPNKLIPA